MEKFLKNQQIPLTQVIDPSTGQAYYAPQNVVYDDKVDSGPTYLRDVIVDQAVSSSYFSGSITNAISASYALTASYVVGFSASSVSSSYALTSSYAFYAVSSSYANYAETASSALNAQDILIYVKNQSGNTIAKGVVVHITASGNSSDIPRVITASYENDNNSANTLGITNQSIANGSEGFVMTEGVLKGIDTNAFVSGQLIYLGPTGSIIGYAPTAPLHSVRLGQVVREQSNNGSIYVRIDNGYELGELHDVVDTTTSSSYGDLLVKSGSVWTNSKQLTGSYAITGSLTATSFTSSNATISGNVTVLGTASINTLVVNQIGYSSGSNQLGDAANDTQTLYGSVIIPTGSLTVTGSTRITGSLGVTGSLSVAGQATVTNGAYIYNNLTIETSNLPVLNLYDSLQTHTWQFRSNGTSLSFLDNGTTRMWIGGIGSGNGGKVGINTINTSAQLTVKGSGTTSATTALLVQNANASASLQVYDDGTTVIGSNTWDSVFYSLWSSYKTRINGGNLSIFSSGGTSTSGPSYELNFYARYFNPGQGYQTGKAGYIVGNAVGISNDNGSGRGTLTLGTVYSNYTTPGERLDPVPTIYMTNTAVNGAITGSGRVGINQSSPSYTLDVNGTTNITGSLLVTGSINVTGGITGSITSASFASTASFVNPLRQTVSLTGSLSITGSAGTGSALYAYKSGSTVLDIQGSQGQLFSVTDALSGSLMSVNDVSGLPILEVFSDDRVVMGTYGAPGLTVSGSTISATGSLLGTASLALTASYVSGSVVAPGSTTQVVFNNGGVLGADNGFVYSGSRVGIGTSTPSDTFHLVGGLKQTRASGTLGVYEITSANADQVLGTWDLYTNTAVTPDFFGKFGFKFEGGTADAFKQYQIHIADSTTPKFIVDGAGRVGIGTSTTSPTARLQVRGSGTTSATTALLIQNANASASLTVKDDGLVAINTTSALVGGEKLAVNGMIVSTGLQVYGNPIYMQAGDPYFAMYDNSTGTSINLQYTAGKLSISKPLSSLTVSGPTVLSGSLTVTGGITGSLLGTASYATTTISASFASTASFINPLRQTVQVTGSILVSGSNPLLRLNGSGSELMSVDGASGRLFTVSDDLTNSLFSVNTIAGLPVIEAYATNDVYLGKYGVYPIKTVTSGTLAVITGSLLGTASFATSASWAPSSPAFPYTGSALITGSLGITGSLTVSGSSTFTNIGPAIFSGSITQNASTASFGGVVGIGTTTPSTTLDIQGDISIGVSGVTTVRTFYNSTTRNQLIYTNNSSLEFFQSVNERMRLAPGSGNLLLNTTTDAGYKLDVNGSARIASSLVADTLSALSGAAVGYLNLVGSVSIINKTQTLYIPLLTRNTTGSEVVYDFSNVGSITATGNVGIGTTTPNAKLDVSGSVVITGSLKVKNGTTPVMDTTLGYLYDTYGNASVSFGGYQLINYYGINSVNWGSYYLIGSSGNISIDWDNRILNDSTGAAKLRWNSAGVQVTGSLAVTQGITGSLLGTASFATSASWAPSSPAFPYTGSARITGSLIITGSTSINGQTYIKGTGTTSATTAFRVDNANSVILFKVNDNGSISHGSASNATGEYSLASGFGVIASGEYSHAEGWDNIANGISSHAEGSATVANGWFSHAEGFLTVADGLLTYNHAEGESTYALGIGAHAEGYFTSASGDHSHAEGAGTKTIDNYQHAQGLYNLPLSGQGAFIVGNGSDNLNRSNLIYAQGTTVQITGSLIISGSSTFKNIGPAEFTGSITQNASTASFGGVVGIGTTTPSATLDVNGTSLFQNDITAYSRMNMYGTLYMNNNITFLSGNVWMSDGYAIGDWGTGNNRIEFYNNRLSFFGNGTEALRIVGSTQNILIGTTTDAGYKLDVKGTGRFTNDTYLATVSGNVGIGTTTPNAKLDVSGSINTNTGLTITGSLLIRGSATIGSATTSSENTLTLGPPPGGGTGEGGQLGLQSTGGSYTSASFIDTWQDQFRILRGSNAGSNAGLMYMNLQTGNTQFVGAVTASAYSGLPNDYLYATRATSNQTVGSAWANTDIIFNNVVVSKGISFNTSTGVASLTGGKVYRVTARLAWSAAATYNLQYSCYTSANVQIGPTVEIIQSTNGTNNISDGTLEFIYAPSSNTDIKIRCTNNNTALSGEQIRYDLNTQFIIQQIA